MAVQGRLRAVLDASVGLSSSHSISCSGPRAWGALMDFGFEGAFAVERGASDHLRETLGDCIQ